MSVTFDNSLATALEVVASEDLTLTHVRWMFAIGQNRNMTDLALTLGFSQAASTGIQDRLESKGFATKAREVGDRRRFIPLLTPKGEEFLQRISSIAEGGASC